MIVAGETSGDRHASRLVNALRKASEAEISFFGSAGPEMRAAGVKPTIEADDLSIVGLLEVARALPMFFSTMSRLKTAAVEEHPDAVILVDFPEFNLKLAKFLHKQRIPVVFYVAPQVWAWRAYRVNSIRRDVDLLLTILPFEKEWFEKRGMDRVKYVGNPLVREVMATKGRDQFALENGLDAKKPIVALLPGSREKEIVRILPIMLAAAKLLHDRRPDLQFVIPLASEKSREIAQRYLEQHELPVKLVVGETYNALNAADAAAVTSGTATLETGILGTPMAVVYRSSALNYRIFIPFISVEHFGLVNLIAGERIAPELIQNDLTASGLADELERMLDPEENRRIREKLKVVNERLGAGGAADLAAEAILGLIEERKS